MKKTPYKYKAEATEAENRIWYILRDRRFHNLKFRRQHMLGKYVVDFYCATKKIVLEIDGGQHVQRVAYDRQRTAALERMGCRVFRFWNNDVLANFESVKEKLYEIVG